jgi:hypothetical protein
MAGKRELIYLVVVGAVTLAGFIIAYFQDAPQVVVVGTGILAGVFAGPWLLIVAAGILAGIVQAFGQTSINTLPWKGGIDGIPSDQIAQFDAKPQVVRFGKVYLWALVNSLVGAVVAVLAFAALYAIMQFVQTAKH